MPCLEKQKNEKKKKEKKSFFSKHKTFHSNKLLFIRDNFLLISSVQGPTFFRGNVNMRLVKKYTQVLQIALINIMLLMK